MTKKDKDNVIDISKVFTGSCLTVIDTISDNGGVITQEVLFEKLKPVSKASSVSIVSMISRNINVLIRVGLLKKNDDKTVEFTEEGKLFNSVMLAMKAKLNK